MKCHRTMLTKLQMITAFHVAKILTAKGGNTKK